MLFYVWFIPLQPNVEFKLELKLAQESREEASALIRGPWPRSPITLSSTCNLMQHGEEGAPPLAPPLPLTLRTVIYD